LTSMNLSWWRRRELNPRPEALRERPLHAQPLLGSRPAASRRGKTAAGPPRIDFAAPSGDPERLHPHFATSAGARRVRSPSKRDYLIKQPERSCCCSQLLFFTFFTRAVRPRHATFRVIVPVEAVSPPRSSPAERLKDRGRMVTPSRAPEFREGLTRGAPRAWNAFA